MKSSPSPRRLAWLACVTVALSVSAQAQDSITLTNGQTREGKILRVTGGNVVMQFGPVQANVALSQVKSVTSPEPAALQRARQALTEKSPAKALAELRPVVEAFRGLPVAWAEYASAMYGTILLDLDRTDEAAKAFDAFQKAYPAAKDLTAVSLGRIAAARKDFVTAKKNVESLAAEAIQKRYASSEKSATYGQALLVMGQVRESEGQYQEALQDYLLAATVFCSDAATATQAQARADTLAKEKNVIAP